MLLRLQHHFQKTLVLVVVLGSSSRTRTTFICILHVAVRARSKLSISNFVLGRLAQVASIDLHPTGHPLQQLAGGHFRLP